MVTKDASDDRPQAAGCLKIFQEHASSIGERVELDRALDYVRGGDTLVVTKVDRLARSTIGLWAIVERLEGIDHGGAGLHPHGSRVEAGDGRCASQRRLPTQGV
ncbi:MAG: recombinase family protein [Bradyrhizobium sp.]